MRTEINKKSDFDFIVLDSEGNAIDMPSNDFTLDIWTWGSKCRFRASSIGGVLKGCNNDGGKLRVYVDNPGFVPGKLVGEWVSYISSEEYQDGTQRTCRYISDFGIDMVDGDSQTNEVQVLAMMQYIQGASAYEIACEYGFEGTEQEWLDSLALPSVQAAKECRQLMAVFSTAETKREENENVRIANEETRVQQESARVSAEEQRTKAEAERRIAENTRELAETTRNTVEQNRKNAEAARVSAENTRKSAEDARIANEATRQTNEQARVAAETLRESAETNRANAEAARVEAEQARAEEFAGFTATIAAKEDVANKVTTIGADADDVHYPSAKAVKDKLNELGRELTGFEESYVLEANYYALNLNTPYKEGTIITDFVGEAFYFYDEQGGIFPTGLLTKDKLPYRLEKDAFKISNLRGGELTIISKGKINTIVENETTPILQDVSEIQDKIVSYFGTKLSIQVEEGYKRIPLDNVLKAGTIIGNFQGSGFYFYSTDGVNDIFPTGLLTKDKLPYRLEKDAAGVTSNTSEELVLKINGSINGLRQVVNIYSSDSQNEIFEKLLEAYNSGDCDVYWETATYVFDSVYLYILETQGWNWTLELPIGGNCRYYLQNSTIISNNTGDETYDGIKPRNTFGCIASGTSFEIYDGTIVNNNGTYCIHDEANGDRGYYKHVYSNLKFVANGCTCCIGAGVGEFADIIIKDCVFESSGTTHSTDVFYHGMEPKHTHISNIKLFIGGCLFTKKFGWGGYIGGNGDRDDVFNLVYTGNKAISVPTNDDNTHISVVSYNNS